MVERLAGRLRKKGWQKEHIRKAVELINNAKQNRHPGIKLMDSLVYWFLLLLIAAGNFTISIGLLPLLLALEGILLYPIVIAVAMAFGLLFELAIRSIEHLEIKHHFFLALVIPLIAAINFLVMAQFAREAQISLGMAERHDYISLSIAYTAAFIIPYIYCKFVLKKGYYSEELEY